jgi:predicted ribosomally synthesized peptide with nif11-like leader
MSEDQLKAFQKAVKADTTLQEKLKAAADTDAVIAIAKAAGFVISAEALLAYQSKQRLEVEKLELNDEQLESVTGGTVLISIICCFSL